MCKIGLFLLAFTIKTSLELEFSAVNLFLLISDAMDESKITLNWSLILLLVAFLLQIMYKESEM